MRLRTLVFAATALVPGCSDTGGGAAAETASARSDSAAPSPAETDSALMVRADLARILGDSTAPVWVVIASDFQCPYCKIWHDSTYPALRREFVDPGRIRLAYLHVPLSQHQHAQVTAELSMCAAAQGRFWEMHDVIFDTQHEWAHLAPGTDYFRSLAARVDLDTARIGRCLDAGTMRPIVAADSRRASQAGLRSTPTFFVGEERRLVGAVPIDSFRNAIADAMRRRAAGAGTSGTP